MVNVTKKKHISLSMQSRWTYCQ